jgi:hypothetical protein
MPIVLFASDLFKVSDVLRALTEDPLELIRPRPKLRVREA